MGAQGCHGEQETLQVQGKKSRIPARGHLGAHLLEDEESTQGQGAPAKHGFASAQAGELPGGSGTSCPSRVRAT